MTNLYVHRDRLKEALSIPATSTSKDALLDEAAEGVCRLIDERLGFAPYPHVRTKYFTATAVCDLNFRTPLLSVTSIRTDRSGNASYDTTWTTADYWLTPYNASAESPARPYWGLETRQNATVTLPSVRRGVEIVGTWGYFDLRQSSTCTLTSNQGATDTSLTIHGSSGLHPGQTILVDSEQIFVRDANPMASGITVERGVNGTSGAAHTSGAAIQVYKYDVIERAALYQIDVDHRAAIEAGTIVPAGGLHPFTERMLNPLRARIAR